MSPTRDKDKLPKEAWIVFFVLLLDLIAFTTILPLLPSLLDYYADRQTVTRDPCYQALRSFVDNFRILTNAPDTSKWNSILFGGVIGSLYSILQFLGSPILGSLSDCFGRRTIFFAAHSGIALSYFVWANSVTFSTFVLSRIIGGLSKGNISVAIAVIADVCGQKTRGKGMALIGVAFAVGFTLGPSIGAYFAYTLSKETYGSGGLFFQYPAYFSLVLSLCCLLLTFLFLPETLPVKNRSIQPRDIFGNAFRLFNPISLFRFSTISSSYNLVSIRKLGVIIFLYIFVYSGLEFTLTFFVHNRFNYTSKDQGRMFVVIGVVMAAVQGGYVRRLKSGVEQRYAVYGMMCLIPAFVIIALSWSAAAFYTGVILFSIAAATVVPCVNTVVSNLTLPEEQGTVMGTLRSLTALARGLGPLLFSALYWSFGATRCYVIGALFMILPLLMLRQVDIPRITPRDGESNGVKST